LIATLPPEGTLAGAVKTPVPQVDPVHPGTVPPEVMVGIVPRVEFPPAVKVPVVLADTDQLMALLVVPLKVAISVSVSPVPMVAFAGARVNETPESRVTVAVPLTLLFALLTAFTVIVLGEGIVAGAVYSPLVAMVPIVEFPPTTSPLPLLTLHVTLVSVTFVTVAAN
jgi:hypothetical protein